MNDNDWNPYRDPLLWFCLGFCSVLAVPVLLTCIAFVVVLFITVAQHAK